MAENGIKIVTFNIRCDYEQDGRNNFSNRKSLIENKINCERPDIICFQEVLPHVAVWLKDTFADYYIIGCGRSEKLDDEQESIAFRKDRFNLVSMSTFWMSETPLAAGSRYKEQSICPRVTTEALLYDLAADKMFRVYNTHLDHEGSSARLLGLNQLLKRIESTEFFPDAPVILAGDFNAEPEAEEMGSIIGSGKFTDAISLSGATFHDYGSLEKEEKIDYIFISGGFGCEKTEKWTDSKDGVYLSDHYPVMAKLYFK